MSTTLAWKQCHPLFLYHDFYLLITNKNSSFPPLASSSSCGNYKDSGLSFQILLLSILKIQRVSEIHHTCFLDSWAIFFFVTDHDPLTRLHQDLVQWSSRQKCAELPRFSLVCQQSTLHHFCAKLAICWRNLWQVSELETIVYPWISERLCHIWLTSKIEWCRVSGEHVSPIFICAINWLGQFEEEFGTWAIGCIINASTFHLMAPFFKLSVLLSYSSSNVLISRVFLMQMVLALNACSFPCILALK